MPLATPDQARSLLHTLQTTLGQRPCMQASLEWAAQHPDRLADVAGAVDQAVVTTNSVERVPVAGDIRNKFGHAAMLGFRRVPRSLQNLWADTSPNAQTLPRLWVENGPQVTQK